MNMQVRRNYNLEAFLHSHRKIWPTMLDEPREPTLFESATAEALHKAYDKSQQSPDQYVAVSAATGAGKTLGAQALMMHIFPATSAIVIKEIKEAHEAYLHLSQFLGADKVAIHTGIHKKGAKAADIAEFEAETGHTIGRSFSEEEFKAAPVVICTHARWKAECEHDTDRGVRACNGEPRNLIIVDEEPSLDCVYVAQPEHVMELASVLTDTELHGEARSFGFCEEHSSAPALRDIASRMGAAKAVGNQPALLAQNDLVMPEEISRVMTLTYDDIYKRLLHLPEGERMGLADHLNNVLKFLVAACDGRVFYSRSARGGQFYAYSYAIPPQRNTMILDGTADMNGLYAVGSSVITLDAPSANYEDSKVSYLVMPKEYSGYSYWRSENIRKVRTSKPFMEWFKSKLLENTKAGEEILVYCPLVLIDTDLPKQLDDQSGSDDPYYSEWEGRKVHWCHFGSGRGTNRFRDCTVFFQIRAFFKPKAATVATTASFTGQKLTEAELRRLSSGKTTDPQYVAVRDTLIACDTKQNATRTCIRKLDDTGRAEAGRLYFVGDDLSQITDHQQQMFPKSGPLEVLVDDLELSKGSSTGTERLAYLLLTSEDTVLEMKHISEVTGIQRQNFSSSLKANQVKAAIAAKGWSLVSRQLIGLKGKGRVFQRK